MRRLERWHELHDLAVFDGSGPVDAVEFADSATRVEAIVESSPFAPLTADQRRRPADLLRPTADRPWGPSAVELLEAVVES